MSEAWKTIPGYEGKYEVSDCGRVRSFRKQALGSIRKLTPNGNGYLRVTLGRGAIFYVHQLVAAAFIGPCPPGQEVRHGDGDRMNNCAVNLSYGTRRENNLDKKRHGTAGNQNTGKTHCIRGHEYTAETTYVYPNGQRCCRTCRNERARSYRAATRAQSA